MPQTMFWRMLNDHSSRNNILKKECLIFSWHQLEQTFIVMILQFSLSFDVSKLILFMVLFAAPLLKLSMCIILCLLLPLLSSMFLPEANFAIPSLLLISLINYICLFLIVCMSDTVRPDALNNSCFCFKMSVQSIHSIILKHHNHPPPTHFLSTPLSPLNSKYKKAKEHFAYI